MRIRREQGLLLVVALIAVWSWSRRDASPSVTRVEAEKKDYEAQAAPNDPLVAALGEAAPLARDPFREPSESEPLEPRPLPFPELGELPVVALPLEPGQQPGAYYQLRLPGAAQPFQFQSEEDEAEPSDGAGSSGSSETAEASDGAGVAQASNQRLYDSIHVRDGATLYGFIRQPDKFALAQQRVFTEPIAYDRVGRDGKILIPNDTIAADQIERVELADTLRNRIELQKRRLGDTAASLPERRAFTEYLLLQARREPWIYEVAAAQADEYARIAKHSVDSYQLKVWVLRERGDLAAQWKLLTDLPEELRESAFAYANRGELEARLGLVLDAEAHLRKAVALEPANPFAQFALARFLLQQGRATAALEPALAARRNRASLTTEEEQFAVTVLVVAVNLAVGDVKGAREAVTNLPTGEAFAARRDELRGAIEYADAKFDAALARFSASVSAGGGGAAALGRAACQIALEKWEEARAGLRAIAAEYPLLRHRAQSGLGLLYLRTGNFEQAREMLETALRAAPHDSYTLYLLGRARRLTGLYDSAIDALGAALAESDDLVEANAEMAASYLALADGAVDAVQALHSARRHVDRLVDNDRAHAIGFLELQGLIRFREADYGAARQTFLAGREASLPCRIGNALVEYRQNHVQESRGMLVELKDELRSGDPTRDYVERTIALIDDHAEKEQVRDAFDRSDLGRNWEPPQGNGVTPRLDGGALRMQGRMREAGRPVFARRVQPTAGKFLRAEVTMTTGAGDHSKAAVLEISMAGSGRNSTEFRARIGKDGKGQAFLLIEDGTPDRARDDEDRQRWDPVALPVPAPAAGKAQTLALAVTPDETGKRLVLEAYWDGDLVHQRPLDRINAKSSSPLFVDLLVEANADEQVDITFDDFRLVRRREK